MFETQKVELLSPDGSIVDAEFRIWEEDPENSDMVKLSLLFLNRELTETDEDFFSAMCSIRRELENESYLPRCYGASRNVYPSTMSRSMGSGSKAYMLRMGEPARQEDLVSIFDSGPDVIPASVSEQEEFYQRWLNSLG